MKKRARLIIACLFCFICSQALFSQETVNLDVIAKIREEGFQRSQVMDIAAYITDVLGARLTASNDMKRAQNWLLEKMERIGLENTKREPFELDGVSWDMEYVSIHMLGPDYHPLVGFPVAFTPGTGGKIKAEAVHVVIVSEEDLVKFKGQLADKIICISPLQEIPERTYRGRRTDEELANLAHEVIPRPLRRRNRGRGDVQNSQLSNEEIEQFFKAEGALLLIQTGSGGDGVVRTFARPGSRTNNSLADVENALPRISLIPEHYNRICRILERKIPVNLEIEVRVNLTDNEKRDFNVTGEIIGADLKNELVMVGGHFDTWHTASGATDNTAGCAVALEAIRILKKIGIRLRRTIRIALWSGEEQGLNGSRAYVQAKFGDPEKGTKPAYNDFSVYFNMDNGTGQFRGINLQSNEFVRPIFQAWIEPLKDLGFTTMTILNTGSTDHISFDRAGLPGFQFVQDRIDHGRGAGHTNNDFYESLREEDLKKNAVIMASFLYNAAMRDKKIPRKTMVTSDD